MYLKFAQNDAPSDMAAITIYTTLSTTKKQQTSTSFGSTQSIEYLTDYAIVWKKIQKLEKLDLVDSQHAVNTIERDFNFILQLKYCTFWLISNIYMVQHTWE